MFERWTKYPLLFALLLVALPAVGQLPLLPAEDCTVHLLNQTIHVQPDGRWEIPNIPVNGGQVRARLHCNGPAGSRVGQSDFFTIKPNRMNAITSILVSENKPGPTQLQLSLDTATLVAASAVATLTVTGLYADGSTKDLSSAELGTNVTSTNPAVAHVEPNGAIIAHTSGVVVITAWNEGVTAAVWVTVLIGDDSDGDGLTDEYENTVGLDPNDPVDALIDHDADDLTALFEFSAGSDPFNPDTDGDGLADGEETQPGEDGYVTSPVKADTDGDWIPDPIELLVGTDPTDPNSVDLDASILSLDVAPASIKLVFSPLVGEASVQVKVVAVLLNGTGVDFTLHPETTFATQNPQIASLGIDPGLVFAGKDGSTQLDVTLASHEAAVPIKVETVTPQALATLPLGCSAGRVALGAKAAHAACNNKMVNVSLVDPTAPTIASVVSAPAYDVSPVDADVLVAAGSSGVQRYGFPTLAQPQLAAELPLPGDTRIVDAQGVLAVAVSTAGDVSILSTLNNGIALLGGATLGTSAVDAGIAPPRAVVVGAGNITVVDLSNPNAPDLGPSLSVGNSVRAVEIQDALGFVAMGNAGMAIVDVSDPQAPALVSTLGPGLFMLQDIAVHDSLAFGADYYRVNSVPIVQFNIPQDPLFVGVVEFSMYSDDNGRGVDVNSELVALTAGNSIYIGRHGKLEDVNGLAPVCTILDPVALASVVEGGLYTVKVSAIDDVLVDSVAITLDGETVATDGQSPFVQSLIMPLGAGQHLVGATATDLAGNVGVCDPVLITLVPDPLTALVGRVVDGEALPVDGALVTVVGSPLEATSQADGTFEISGVPTAIPPGLEVTGEALGFVVLDKFGPFQTVGAGVTDVGDLILKTPVAKYVLAPVVAQSVGFWAGTFDTMPGTSLLQPLVASSVAFHGSVFDSTSGSDLIQPVVAASVPFSSSAFDTAQSIDVQQPLAAASVGFSAASFDLTNIENGELQPLAAASVGFTAGFEDTLKTTTLEPIAAASVGFSAAFDVTSLSDSLEPVVSSSVSFVGGPLIQELSPDLATVLDTEFVLTVSGLGLAGATAILFIEAGEEVPWITATAPQPGAEPNTLTATVTLTVEAVPAELIVVVVTPDGESPDIETQSNILVVEP